MGNDKIPYFIKMRGCINCSASKRHKERHGTDYGFDHEIIAQCVLMGCVGYGHDLSSPFMDAKEIVRFTEEKRGKLTPEEIENTRQYLIRIKERFGEFYEKIGVSIDDLIEQI